MTGSLTIVPDPEGVQDEKLALIQSRLSAAFERLTVAKTDEEFEGAKAEARAAAKQCDEFLKAWKADWKR